MHIRPMQTQDKEHVLAMMQVFYASPAVHVKASTNVLQQDIEDCISDMPFIEGYVFEENNALLGYAMVAKSYSTEYGGICLWLEDIYLLPQARGKGIGGQLFTFLEKKYKGKAVRLRLEVSNDNASAIKAYEKMGLTQMDYVQMTKNM